MDFQCIGRLWAAQFSELICKACIVNLKNKTTSIKCDELSAVKTRTCHTMEILFSFVWYKSLDKFCTKTCNNYICQSRKAFSFKSILCSIHDFYIWNSKHKIWCTWWFVFLWDLFQAKTFSKISNWFDLILITIFIIVMNKHMIYEINLFTIKDNKVSSWVVSFDGHCL